MRSLLAAMLLVAAACAPPTASTSHTPSPSASPSSTPSPAGPLLFAALEAKGALAYRPDTIAIAGLDGHARAKSTFKPIVPPAVGCLGTRLPTAAYVAAGKVFFADGSGVVRSLSPGGEVKTVASFPTSSMQILSFAVSPDGARLLASVLTVPRMISRPAACAGSAHVYAGVFSQAVFSAEAEGHPVLLYHQVMSLGASNQYPCVLEFAGWSLAGPFGMKPACLGPGGGPVHYPGTAIKIDAVTGQALNPVADPKSCRVEDIAIDGDYVCTPVTPSTACCGTGDISVRRPDGSEIWRFTAQPNQGYEYDFLSPDEHHVVAAGPSVLGQDGTAVKLASDHVYNGWLDSSTVIGYESNGNLGYATLKSPATLVDIGFKGAFVGTVSG